MKHPNIELFHKSSSATAMRRILYLVTTFFLALTASAEHYDVPGTNITLTYLFNEEMTFSKIVSCNQDAVGHVTIPATLGGKPVQVIGDSAFRFCVGLTGVTLPDSITQIEKNAFVTCSGITSMNAPESLASVGAGALSPTSVTFHEENNLKYFMNSTSAFMVDASNASGDVIVPSHVNGLPVISANGGFGGNITSVTIPGTVAEVGDSAFFNSSLSTIILSEGVSHIGRDAFKRCASLQNVTLPTSLRSIGHGAFAETSSLYDLVLPEGLIELGTYAFSKSNIKTVSFPGSLSMVDDYAFIDCVYLEGVDLSNTSVASVGRNAFDGCRRMTSALMGYNVISIGAYAFRNASDLDNIDFGNKLEVIESYAFSSCDALTEITLPDSLIEIQSNAFRSCYALSTVNFGSGIQTIGREAFKYCRGITEAAIPNSLTELGNGAFSGCTGITSVEISNQLTTINYEAFLGCAKIESIVLPESVTKIEGRAFLNCSSLTNITFGSDLNSIGDSAFWNCKLLQNVSFPDSLRTIGIQAFSSCESMTQVIIPASVEQIGEAAFSACISLVTLTVESANAHYTSLDDILYDKSGTQLIFCPANKNGALSIPQGVTTINDYAFSGCRLITTLTLPNSVTLIGQYSFLNCDLLGAIFIPNSVTSIGKYAFRYCSSLKSITLPKSISSLEGRIFEGCYSLETVVFDGNNPTSDSTLFNNTSYSLSVVRYENTTGFGPTLHGRNVSVLYLDEDDDLDGNSNELERLVGTNPLDAASKFSIWLEGTDRLHFTPLKHDVQDVCLWTKELNSTAENWNELALLPINHSFELPSVESPPFNETDGINIFFKLQVSQGN